MVPQNAFLVVVSILSAQPTWADNIDSNLLDCVAEAMIMKRTVGELFENDSDTYLNIADASEALNFFYVMSNLPEDMSASPNPNSEVVANRYNASILEYDRITSDKGVEAALKENEVRYLRCLIEFRDEIKSSSALIRSID